MISRSGFSRARRHLPAAFGAACLALCGLGGCNNPTGLELTADDLLRRTIIQALMCQFEISIESLEISYLIDFKTCFQEEIRLLREYEQEGMLTLDDQWLSVTSKGRLLIRTICMVFDKYLRAERERQRYSKVI